MESDKKVGEAGEPAFPRRVPAMLIYLSPFRVVENDTLPKWSTTIEEINRRTWDYVKLHEVVGGLDVGLEQPFHMLVGRDGALALPPIPRLCGQQEAIEFYNKCLAALLLGGVYCEAVTPDNLALGSVIDWKYIRVLNHGQGARNRLHNLFRMQMASPIDAIELLQPRSVAFNDLAEAMKIGLQSLSTIPRLSGEFLVKGTSGIARRDWGVALTNLWITAEQVTAHLWDMHLLRGDSDLEPRIEGRRDQLKDTRSWTASLRQEVLYQKGILRHTTLKDLSLARKARNDLVHSGRHPTESSAIAAFEATKALLEAALERRDLPLFKMNVMDHMLSDPFVRRETRIDPQYWMPIPKLPGEEDLEKEEAGRRTTTGDA